MGKHSADPVPQEPDPPLRGRMLRYAAGVTATLVAWGYLVFAAIEFGGKARDGERAGWVFLAAATVGATACLFVTLMLVGKLLATLRGDVPPARSGTPGKRAAR